MLTHYRGSGLVLPEILYIQFSNPTAYPPLEHSALMMQSQGWRVRFLGVRWPWGNFSFTNALRAHLRLMAAPSPGWRQKLFFLRYIACVLVSASLRPPNWVYVSDPMAAPAGLLLCLLGFRVAYHEHDSPDGVPRTRFDALIRYCRRQLARRAAFNVLPQDERCRIFKETTSTLRPVLRVWNCPRRDELCSHSRPPRQPYEPLGIYYHGSINLTLLPLELIEAAGQSSVPIVIRAVGYETVGSAGTSDLLRQAADPYKETLRLELPGSTSRYDLPRHMRGMHLGWIAYNEENTDINLKHLAGASNKAFDYLANALPLIINQSPEWQSIFMPHDLAIGCDAASIREIAKCILWAYNDPFEISRMSENARQATLSIFNFDSQFLSAKEALISK